MTGMAGMAVASLLQTALLARELGASGLGIIASVIAVSTITSALVSFRTTEAVTRWLSEPMIKRSPRALSGLMSSALLAEVIPRAIASIALLASAPALALAFAESSANSTLFMLHGVTILLIVPQTVWMSLMREERRFALIAGLEAGTAFIRLGALALAAVSGHLTLLLAVVIVVIAALGKALYQTLQIRYSLRRRRCARLSLKAAWFGRRKLSEFWKLMRSGYLASTFIAPFKYGDVLLLGAFTSTTDVGLYKAAKTIVTLLQTACNTLATVMFQDMNDALRAGRTDHLRLILVRITKMWAPILILLVVVSIPVAPISADFIFGRDFVSGVPIFYVLLMGAIPGLLTFWSIQLAIATDAYVKALPLFYWTQLFNYILAIWLTWSHGAMGMAAAIGLHWTLSFTVFLPYSLPRIRKSQSLAV